MLTNPIYTKNKCVSYINVFHIFTSAGILINVNYTYIYGVIQNIYKTIIIIIKEDRPKEDLRRIKQE